MKYVRLILILVLAAISINVSAGKKKKVWPTDSAYITHRRATIIAMDSVLKYSGLNPDPLMRFADQKCTEFNNDPELMRGIASSFVFNAGYVNEGIQRYKEIKRLYPNYLEGYLDYAATLHSIGIKVELNEDGGAKVIQDSTIRRLAKAQIDSAKVVFPTSKQPYKFWLSLCARYGFYPPIIEEMEQEALAFQKAFPNENGFYEAGDVLSNAIDNKKLDIDLLTTIRQNNLRYNSMQNVVKLFDKANPNTMTAGQLNNLSLYYYQTVGKWRTNLDPQERIPFFEKGLELARLGIERFPDSINFRRLVLYNSAELAKYDSDKNELYSKMANQISDSLFSHSTTLLREDYFYYGLTLQNVERYSEAIDFYKKALDKKLLYLDRSFNRDSLTTLQNLSDCCRNIKDYDNALTWLKILNDKKKKYGYPVIKRLDMNNLVRLYTLIGNDTTKTLSERFQAYVTVDSIYTEMEDSISNGFRDLEGTLTFDNLRNKAEPGDYTFRRFQIRQNYMDKMEGYNERENYLTTDMANEVIDKIKGIKTELSENQIKNIVNAAIFLMNYYAAKERKDYKTAVKYVDIAIEYAPNINTKENREIFNKWRQNARKQR